MVYLLAFLEGMITFISPCILPLLPIYVAYFVGGQVRKSNRAIFFNVVFFILGFSVIFVSLGIFAGWIGAFFIRHQRLIQLITGSFVVVAGLSFLTDWRLFNSSGGGKKQRFNPTTMTNSLGGFFMFGMVFALAWSPCLGAFLGSALSLASHQGTMLAGAGMLLLYSLGLGVPFLLSAFLLDALQGAFLKVKQNSILLSKVAGMFLIVLGILMLSGLLAKWQLFFLPK